MKHILHRRSEDVKNRQGISNHANLLTGKLWCTHCGTAYYRRESKDKYGNKNSKWVCSGKINNGSDSCDSFAIYESEIKPLLFEVFKETKADADALAEEYARMYQSLTDETNLQQLIEQQREIIGMAAKKKGKLLQLVVEDNISNSDFKLLSGQCDEETAAAERELAELESRQNSNEEFRRNIDAIRATLRMAEHDTAGGGITKEFVDQYIDKIFVTPGPDGSMKLEIKIFTGETSEKYLQKLAFRTGHTSKKMIQAYENGMK